MPILWSELALDDFDSIVFYFADYSVSAALRMDSDISRHVDLLGDYPSMGRTGRIAGTRELVVARARCVVVYRVDEDAVRILRLLHGAQEWPLAFTPGR